MRAAAAAAALAVALTGCPPPAPPPCDPDIEDCSDAGPPQVICNHPDDALNDPRCTLGPCPKPDGGGAYKQSYISVSGEQGDACSSLPRSSFL